MSDSSDLDEDLVTRLGWMHSGTRFFEAQLAQLSDADLLEPSRLPGWTRRHVLSHMANNATALMNLLDWARTGVENPMYDSREQRAADIESGAQRPAAELRTEAIVTADRLAAAIDAMPRPAWAGTIRTALGRPVTGFEVPWMRVREVWVHGVDLGASATFADIDPEVTLALLDEAVRSLAGRADCPPVRIVTDRGDVFGIGPMGAETVDVRGTTTAVGAWVLGRSSGSDLVAPAGLPVLPPWL
jgi:maleylpyruvate isomerase